MKELSLLDCYKELSLLFENIEPDYWSRLINKKYAIPTYELIEQINIKHTQRGLDVESLPDNQESVEKCVLKILETRKKFVGQVLVTFVSKQKGFIVEARDIKKTFMETYNEKFGSYPNIYFDDYHIFFYDDYSLYLFEHPGIIHELSLINI